MISTCGGCDRSIPDGRIDCMYCGWQPGQQEAVPRLVADAEDFVEGGTLLRFAFSSLILTPIAIALLVSDGTASSVGMRVLALVLLALGPLALLLQLCRRFRGRIEVTRHGLQFENGQELFWNQIDSVDLHLGLISDFAVHVGEFASGSGGLVRIMRFVLGGRIGLSVFVAPLMFFGYFLIPAVGVLTPFHSRVILTSKNGDRRVLHDLSDAWPLYLVVSSKLRSAETPVRRAA